MRYNSGIAQEGLSVYVVILKRGGLEWQGLLQRRETCRRAWSAPTAKARISHRVTAYEKPTKS
jgi:hypothetical protein